MSEPNFRPWTRRHYAYLLVISAAVGCAWWFVPWVSWVSDFFDPLLPSPRLIWKVRDRDLHGRAFAFGVGKDASIYVVGDTQGPGMGSYPVTYEAPFLARYGSDGKLVWKHVFSEDKGGDRPVVHDVTSLPNGQICALSHHYATFDNLRVRCFDPDGEPTVDHALAAPRSTRMSASVDGALVLGGSEVLSWRNGLAVGAAWVAELRRGVLRWSGKRAGKLGGLSEVRALARGRSGEIVAGGSIGRGHGVAQPWLSRWSSDGKLLWSQVMPCYAWMHQAIVEVAVTNGGHILAAGHCDYPWVRRYAKDGLLLWEHRFAQRDFPVSLYPTERGFVVASVRTADRWGRIGLSSTIRHVSALGVARSSIRWRGCEALTRIRPAPDGGVIALGTCKNALTLAKFAAP